LESLQIQDFNAARNTLLKNMSTNSIYIREAKCAASMLVGTDKLAVAKFHA
jgi:hypothetical protein